MNNDEIGNSLYTSDHIRNYSNEADRQNHLLEQYKLYLASAENISDRRQTANSFFVTVNTALVTLLGYLNADPEESTNLHWLVSISGIVISYMWYRLIRSYKDLNSAKFKVIHLIERKLPLNLFAAEWDAVGRGENSNLYLPFTHIEVYIPWVFAALHGSFLFV